MKYKILAISSVALLSSCSWTARQADGMMDWANRTMPTYDGSRPGVKPAASGGAGYNGYPYNNAARPPMTAPGVSDTPSLPGTGMVSDKGMTAAQSASAYEGGNSRPRMGAAPAYPTPMMAPAASTSGRRAPAAQMPQATPPSQLPPSAIQPTPYGMHQPAAKQGDDFPSEYNNSMPTGMGSGYDPMIPPPPI